ncbi:glyoxylase-like metal-dependent hydrolase (beta-lactamase superfamily II) [Kutzneria kofuensis]|uniref:Glyoxylase-like metal-dependent hydrolase (Beta-lactamase superfamily II) n=2 Tax=Kutzneria kofuensis TaxID=103725 RepID=A0A7W9KNA7_9PSEU|nr:glyoxylase-like metal-dependent hydrolase (beta-lactamase superfamily II) [Kutzneria kofuensis]
MATDIADARTAWMEPGAYEVAPGVHRIPLPLPNDGLRAVNVYAVADGDELVLVDSGWALDEARDQLEQALGSIGHGFESISRFLVTHVHRDHYTLGITLRRMFGSRVSLGIGEQPSLEAILHGRVEGQLNDLVRWGAEDIAERMRQGMKKGGPRQDGYEQPDEWIRGATDIRLETRTLRALPTPGHTAGHLVFLDADSSLLFAGDHILPHITPSIGFELVRQELPLGDYLDSLRLVREHPEMRLLPAHGPVADSTHVRVDELLDHHRRRLDETEHALAQDEATAAEVAARMGWTRHNRKLSEMDIFNRMLAIGETSAHLDVLVRDGRLRSSTVDGVARYRA